MPEKIIALIAAYNEEAKIADVVRNTLKFTDKVIIVDDGSSDKTLSIASSGGAKVVKLERNVGKGGALRVGLKHALALKPQVIVLLDGDGQHDPKYIPEFVAKINNGADMVYGRRDLTNYPINRKIGNWGLSTLSNILCPTGIKDTECGFRVLSGEAAKKIDLKAVRYAIEMDFVHAAWKNKFKIDDVSIEVPYFVPKPAFVRGLKNFFYLLKRRFNLV